MEPTLTTEEVCRILKVSRRSLNDPAFRARIGLRGYCLGTRTIRFLARDVEQVLRLDGRGDEASTGQ